MTELDVEIGCQKEILNLVIVEEDLISRATARNYRRSLEPTIPDPRLERACLLTSDVACCANFRRQWAQSRVRILGKLHQVQRVDELFVKYGQGVDISHCHDKVVEFLGVQKVKYTANYDPHRCRNCYCSWCRDAVLEETTEAQRPPDRSVGPADVRLARKLLQDRRSLPFLKPPTLSATDGFPVRQIQYEKDE